MLLVLIGVCLAAIIVVAWDITQGGLQPGEVPPVNGYDPGLYTPFTYAPEAGR